MSSFKNISSHEFAAGCDVFSENSFKEAERAACGERPLSALHQNGAGLKGGCAPLFEGNTRSQPPYICKRLLITTLFVFLTIMSANSLSSKDSLRKVSRKSLPQIAESKNLRGASADIDSEEYYSNQLEQLNLRLLAGNEHRKDSSETPKSSRRCRSLVYQSLMRLPYSHRTELSSLTLFYTKDGRRGLGGNSSIVLRCLNVTDSELVSVLVHEMGHLADSGLLKGSNYEKSGFYDFEIPISSDDPSLDFYRISWLSDKKRLSGSTALDFVSLYAATDPFEDFAETYTYYRLHGSDFRQLALFNDKLAKKYEFMKTRVFEDQEFGDLNNDAQINIYQRNYDVTVLPFPLKDFLAN